MERIEADATPAEEWLETLNATCNRLMTQYMNLLRSASSINALEEEGLVVSSSSATGTSGVAATVTTAVPTLTEQGGAATGNSSTNTSTSGTGSNTTTATSASANTTTGTGTHDPRAGGGHMKNSNDPPPPPLASDVATSTVQCQIACENICVAISNIISLIRTIKLSLLLNDTSTIIAEEYCQVQTTKNITYNAIQQSILLESNLLQKLNK